MTVGTIINEYNENTHNQIDDKRKIRWLKRLETMIIREVVMTHKLPERGWHLEGETLFMRGNLADLSDFTVDTELIVPEPYADVYLYWLDQKIAYANHETIKYNAASSAFNNAYITYQQWYNRTHDPLPRKSHLFHHEVL
ncbi:hypothetical protein [Lachnoclostridium sp. Marseille-P6806]|uniref:hypothetical protein n=1 Tax=Lachnoclostridium sp. Marseille-P6806 TaxID=2364793 RepID=UPI00102FF830|nr:hypothetical protein [Lachnoclostridium sp. Marseille-P6806]